MRTTFTTSELTSRLARPAFRALEGVARQLGVKLPAQARDADSHEESSRATPGGDAAQGPSVEETRATASHGHAASGPLAPRSSPVVRPGAAGASTALADTAPRSVVSSRIPVTPSAPRASEVSGSVSPASEEWVASPLDLAPSSKRTGLSSANDLASSAKSLAHASASDLTPSSKSLAHPSAPSTNSIAPVSASDLTPSSTSIGRHLASGPRDSGLAHAADASPETSQAPHPTWPESGARHASSLPSDFSAGASRRSELPDKGAPASSHTAETASAPSPHRAPEEHSATSSDAPSGLRVSVKSPEPRPLQKKVVRLMQPLPPPSEAPATESGPTVQRVGPPTARLADAPRHDAPEAVVGPHYEGVTSTSATPRPPASPVEATNETRTSIAPVLPVLRVLSTTPAALHSPAAVPTTPAAAHAPAEAVATRPTVRPVAPSGPRPKARLTFTPPEPVAPSSSPEPERAVPPASLATSHVARQVNQGVTPVLERAQQLTHESLTIDRSSRSTTAPSADSGANAAVRNTFNVNVQVGTDTATSGMDRRTLEDTLVDILRETARRHGLEV
ncbi:hypothetical protein [Myxococcus eversor]|uniref:hypothetical protein n=1 Tax=Myxococcus eversor TaxID=2709661 RepID=UPI0013D59E84|nr:hypothetical protein [Myxococcus eversor]